MSDEKKPAPQKAEKPAPVKTEAKASADSSPASPGVGTNGKGDAPRNCFSDTFRSNFDTIDWSK